MASMASPVWRPHRVLNKASLHESKARGGKLCLSMYVLGDRALSFQLRVYTHCVVSCKLLQRTGVQAPGQVAIPV